MERLLCIVRVNVTGALYSRAMENLRCLSLLTYKGKFRVKKDRSPCIVLFKNIMWFLVAL